MKKWIALLLACVLCLSICGCGAQATTIEETTESTEPTEKFDWSLNGSSNSGCAMDEVSSE